MKWLKKTAVSDRFVLKVRGDVSVDIAGSIWEAEAIARIPVHETSTFSQWDNIKYELQHISPENITVAHFKKVSEDLKGPTVVEEIDVPTEVKDALMIKAKAITPEEWFNYYLKYNTGAVRSTEDLDDEGE